MYDSDIAENQDGDSTCYYVDNYELLIISDLMFQLLNYVILNIIRISNYMLLCTVDHSQLFIFSQSNYSVKNVFKNIPAIVQEYRIINNEDPLTALIFNRIST